MVEPPARNRLRIAERRDGFADRYDDAMRDDLAVHQHEAPTIEPVQHVEQVARITGQPSMLVPIGQQSPPGPSGRGPRCRDVLCAIVRRGGHDLLAP